MMIWQQDIFICLFEYEKVECECEYEEKCKVEQVSQQEWEVFFLFEEYIKKWEVEIDLYKMVNFFFKLYYKFIVEEYFKILKMD